MLIFDRFVEDGQCHTNRSSTFGALKMMHSGGSLPLAMYFTDRENGAQVLR